MENDRSYFHRRAAQEHSAATNSRGKAREAHETMEDRYRDLAPDCMGRWVVYWRQNMPGFANLAYDDTGAAMKNWWPFLFY